ncbi:SCO6880 family protein [Streptomyces malaysiensis]|uniref:SCO6880 family protein n=1 Tax=Streptomyces malaysiensis TaxID=92644 RepID=UPI000BFB67CD|nr:SCO6880 family protein [Streptomyces malaysiensis]ATL88787.1 putative integral membrane protein [Streptomyces malaysiensis]
MSQSEPATYAGWQSERQGFVGSLSLTGCVLLAAAALCVLLPVYTQNWSAELIAIPFGAMFYALARVPIYGMTAEEWARLAIRHQINVAGGRDVFLSGVFAPRRKKDDQQPMDLPGILARLKILSAPIGGQEEIAVVYDPLANSYSATLEIRYPGLALEDTDQINRRVAAWGAFLRAQCMEGGPIVRISVHERSLPDNGTALQSWTALHISPDAPAAAVDVVTQLAAQGGPVANARTTYLTITLSATRARLAVKGAGGGRLGACAVLVRELTAMQSALAAADLKVTAQLKPRQLAQAIREAFDPDAVAEMAVRNAAAEQPEWQGVEPGVDPRLAGPAGHEVERSRYLHDGAVSVTYQVRNWPASAVYATCLQPLMRPRPNARRSLSLTYEPLGPRRARTELSRARTKRDVARRLRARTGRIESMDERAEMVRSLEQDAARAGGHGIVRFTGLVTVTVTDEEELETACAELQQDGAAAGLELRRMYYAQDSGFAAAALPLGLGLPERRPVI